MKNQRWTGFLSVQSLVMVLREPHLLTPSVEALHSQCCREDVSGSLPVINHWESIAFVCVCVSVRGCCRRPMTRLWRLTSMSHSPRPHWRCRYPWPPKPHLLCAAHTQSHSTVPLVTLLKDLLPLHSQAAVVTSQRRPALLPSLPVTADLPLLVLLVGACTLVRVTVWTDCPICFHSIGATKEQSV